MNCFCLAPSVSALPVMLHVLSTECFKGTPASLDSGRLSLSLLLTLHTTLIGSQTDNLLRLCCSQHGRLRLT